MLHVTRQARRFGLPLAREQLVARSGAQIAGLHAGAVRTVLAEHGVCNVRMGEAGRTNPNNVARAYAYATLLDNQRITDDTVFAAIEAWWVRRLPPRTEVPEIKWHWRTNRSVAWTVRRLHAQIEAKYHEIERGNVAKMLTAGLAAALLSYQHRRNTGADEVATVSVLPGGRSDLLLELANCAAVVTDFPAETVRATLRYLLRRRKRVMLVCVGETTAIAAQLLASDGLEDSVDILNLVQWLTAVLHCTGQLCDNRQRQAIGELVTYYQRTAAAAGVALPPLLLD
jgi:hypothetical protein